MRRAFLGFVFALLTLASTSRADAPTPATRVDDAVRFADLARSGDKARADGRLSDAVRAYTAALELKNDAVIAGRLGLVAFNGGAIALSVNFLLRGVTDGQKASLAERHQVKDAYDLARSLVCRVNVSVSQLDAVVSIDGEPQPWATSRGEFYAFVLPGRHVFRAHLEGYEDATETIDAPKGEELPVRLTLSPLKEKPESVPAPSPEPPPKPAPTIAKETPAPIQAQQPTQTAAPLKRDDSTIKQFSPWAFGFGPVMVVGAVSQWPAFGFVGSAHKKIDDVFLVRFDARWAEAQNDLEGRPIRGMTFGVLPAGCAFSGVFSACLLGHIGAIVHRIDSPVSISLWRHAVGLGASIGFDKPIGRHFGVRFAADFVILPDRVDVNSGTSGQHTIWSGPPVLGGLSLSVWRSGT